MIALLTATEPVRSYVEAPMEVIGRHRHWVCPIGA
jgi:hypothetical protein